VSTRLSGLSLYRFCNLPAYSVEFADGLVLVRGPNEAGKSSLVEAVFFALFRDAGSTAREITQAITWGLSSRPVVELTLEVDGEEYVLRRDYAAKKNLLRNTTTGDEWHDKKTIAVKVKELLGLESEALVRSTVCVQADELQRVDEAGDDLRVLLEQKVSGVGDVDLGAIDEQLDKEIREIKPPRKRDVGLWKADDDVARLREARDVVQRALDEQAKLRAVFYTGQRELPELQAELADTSQSLERAAAFAGAKARHEAADAALEHAMERLQAREAAEQQRAAASAELDRLRPLLQVDEREAETEARAAADRELLASRLAHAEKDAARLEKSLTEARECERERDEAAAALASLGALPARGELQRLLALKTTIETVDALRATQRATLEVRARRDVALRIDARQHDLRAGESAATEVLGEARVVVGDLAEVRVVIGAEELAARVSECEAMRAELEARLSELSAADLAELQRRAERADELHVARRGAADRLVAIAGEGATDDLASRLAEARADAERLRSELAAAPAAGEGAVARRDSLRDEVGEWARRLNLAEGRLIDLPGEETLKQEQRAAAKEALKAEQALDEQRAYALTASELVRLQDKVGELRRRQEQLQIDLGIWGGRLDGAYEAADLEAAQEALDAAEARAARLRRRVEVLELVREVLAEARLTVGGNVAGLVARRTGEMLSVVTDGRYDEVRVDPETLSIEVHRARGEGPEWIPAAAPQLSTGTLDQVYLAARVALSEALVHERRPFWLLDDPLAHADSGRRAKALALLKEVASDRQVILFTCHDYGTDVAHQVVELGDVRVSSPA
jgi:DNA repair exonuclease SbcCD ATPase subunit